MSNASTLPSPTEATHRLGLWLALLGAMAFSGKAILVKIIYRYGVDPATLIMLRMSLALPFFLAMVWWASRGAQARENPLTRSDLAACVGLGFLGYYLASYLDFLGLQFITASLERLILYLNPTLVMILSWLMYRQQVTLQRMLAMGLSYVGVLVVFGHEARLEGAHVVLGVVLVFLSALAYALYLIFSGRLVKRLGSMRLVGMASSFACLMSVIQYLVMQPMSLADIPAPVWGLSLANAVVCTVAPVLMVMMAVERIGAGLAAQAGMVGPMATLALGVLVLDEPFNQWVILGTLLVLSGVYMVSRSGGK
ncbi:MAG: EamA/RhaT family transporter [Betaproteobacteria bacterium]|jgi:drug/metabolite transporter (DMT)-like permease|nr:EamA/RhaT family transporter [Betaproteobacteria bacterium]NBP43666.1 EamA/RhaT family transporter [Betaproteobacteria bacterium]